jgi:hypothetical protein
MEFRKLPALSSRMECPAITTGVSRCVAVNEQGMTCADSDVLWQQVVVVDTWELKRLPHDVVVSERLLACVGRDAGDAVSP